MRSFVLNVVRWFDADSTAVDVSASEAFNWWRCIPFIMVHLACLAVIWVGWSWTAVAVAIFLYVLRMFAITAFYHRYFSHRSFKASRFVQFVFAVIGCTAVQRGPLWWAAHHRGHHRHSDSERDIHSPHYKGFLWSHFGWFTCDVHFPTNYDKVKDFKDYGELRWLNRYDMVVPFLFAVLIFALGAALQHLAPQLGTNGWQLLVWGFFISTVAVWHVTFSVNSLAHLFGSRPYDTDDTSRNNWWLALLTMGEGWHNNHHRFPGAARQGFRWWEFDMTYYILKFMAAVGLIWDLRAVPERIKSEPMLHRHEGGFKCA